MRDSAQASSANPTAVLAIVLVSYLMIVIDISIVITGLPKIKESFGLAAAELSWVQNAYTLALGGLLLLGARAGDILGRRHMFVAGLALLTAASLAIGLAPSAGWLIAGRAVQGIGAATLVPSTLALLTTNFPEGPARTRALAHYAAIAGLGGSLGLMLGGVVADWLSWRVGFFINVPIGIALILSARRWLAETERRTGAFDLAGAIGSTLGMTALVFAIVRSASVGWGAWTIGALATALLLLVFFIFHESRARQPILPLRLFASRERAAAYLARVLYIGAMAGFWFFTTQYLQGVMCYGPFAAGAAFLPTTLPNLASAMLVPRLARRLGNGRLLAGAIALTLIGMFWLSRVSANAAYLTDVALPMMLIGLGQGGALGPLTIAEVAGVAREDAGAAAGLVNVAHQIGASLGLAVLVAVFAWAGSGLVDERALLADRVSAALTGGAAMLALALVAFSTTFFGARKAVGA